MFSGLMSRWTMPFRCASESELHTCETIFPSRRKGMGPSLRSALPRLSPLTSSITRYVSPSETPKSKTWTVFGLWSLETASASRLNRRTTSGWCDISPASTFMARSLPIRTCWTL